jgi:predicted Zn-dependent peptidase
MHKVEDLYEELVFGGSTLGRNIIGTKDTIRAATREQMVDYFNRFYHDHNSILCVAGAVPANAEELLNQYWNKPVADGEQKTGKVYQPCVVNQTEPRLFTYKKAVEQAHLQLGFVSEGFTSEDFYTYQVLCTIFGGGMSSRLFEELREKRGLCYYIRMYPDLYEDAGSLVVKAGLNQEKIEEAITVILDELKKIKADGVEEKELQKAKDFLIGNLILDQEDSAHVAEMYLRQYVIAGNLVTPDEKIAKVRLVTAEDIKRVANKLFVNQGLNLALIVNEPKEENYKKLLNI